MTTEARVGRSWDSIFDRRGWLAEAEEPLRLAILAKGRAIRLDRRARVFDSHDPPGGIYGVVSGGIGIQGCSQWHALRLGHILRAGDWFGYRSAVAGGGRSMGFIAIEPSELVYVSLPALSLLKRESPALEALLAAMAIRGDELGNLVACDLLIRNARRRIAAVLLRVTGAHENVQPSDPRGFILSQTELGDMANVSRHHTNRTLTFLQSQGWIEMSYVHIRLLDVAALAEFAYGEG
jgi:CRP-like cAMP-binding protein